MKKLYICLIVVLSIVNTAHANDVLSDKAVIPLGDKKVESSGDSIFGSYILVSIAGAEKKLLLECQHGVIGTAVLIKASNINTAVISRGFGFSSEKSFMVSDSLLYSRFSKCSDLVDEIKLSKTIVLDKLNDAILFINKRPY